MSRQSGSTRRGLPPEAAGIPAPADKRFRRSDVRQGRRRTWGARLRRAAIIAAGALVVLALAAWVGGVLVDASVLRVDRLVVRGNARISGADIESLLSGIRGESIVRVDLEHYQRRLRESPWVATAELWRVLPSTVHVQIVERTPLAIARLQGQLYLVDDTGVIIDRFGPEYSQFDVPIVDGLVATRAAGGPVDPARIHLVQRLFADVLVREDLFKRLSQVDVSDARNAIVLIDGERAALHLGDREFLQRLERYEELATSLADQPPQEYYLLRFGDRVWVK